MRDVYSPPNSSFEREANGRSLAVITARTPGNASALLVSMDLILAWAWGLRNTLARSVPVKFVSSPYRARPVTLSTPSGRTGRLPTTSYSTSDKTWFEVMSQYPRKIKPEPQVLVEELRLIAISDCRLFSFAYLHHGPDDLVIAGAATEVARQPVTDPPFVGFGLLVQ